tara:strand:- start:1433 stop:2005 length:573 start_codon:yes stop_codon:yes gene_type:complete
MIRKGSRPRTTLLPREERFITDYLIDFNGPRAYIAAGYSKRSASNGVYTLLKRPLIQQALAARKAKVLTGLAITHERVLEELARVAFSDPRQVFDEAGVLLPPRNVDDATASSVASFETTSKPGSPAVTSKVRHHDKVAALRSLMEYFKPLTGANGATKVVNIDPATLAKMTDADLAQAVAHLKTLFNLA